MAAARRLEVLKHSPLETHAVGGPGRNLPRSLRTSLPPVPNFGANGRGKRPSAPDAATKPADAAAAHAIDAVRAVGDVSVQAIRRRRTDAVVEMTVLTNYCVAAFRDEPRVLPINSSS